MKKWYAVYVKPGSEKKVAQALEWKQIEVYCPVVRATPKLAERKKGIEQLLFAPYLFVCTTEAQHALIKNTDGVLNLLYWLGEPVVIRDIEIEMTKRFLGEHDNIRLEKVPVQKEEMVTLAGNTTIEAQGKELVEMESFRLFLPSLGYLLTSTARKNDLKVDAKSGSTVKRSWGFSYIKSNRGQS